MGMMDGGGRQNRQYLNASTDDVLSTFEGMGRTSGLPRQAAIPP